MTTTTVDLQIIGFHNCSKCIRKVERALCGFVGVKLLDVDPENGKFTIETTRHPEEIRNALQRKFGKSVILSNRINHSDPSSALNNPHNSTIQGPHNIHEMAEALIKEYRDKGVENVEITQSSTMKMKFSDQSTTSGSTTTPRYQPTTSGSATRPENYWGSSGSNAGYGYVPQPPPPPPPPPPRYQPTTSGSTWPRENVWGSGYVPQPPPPPRTTTEPSAPLIPTTQGQGHVYGYPIELYGFAASTEDDYSCGTIL